MNSRIYLQPDAVPVQDEIRTANRLFRHFEKEVTFLQRSGIADPDITMNRLRWAIIKVGENLSDGLTRSGNLIADLAYLPSVDEKSLRAAFDENEEIANLLIIQKSETVITLAKEDQTKAKRK
jgi:hypothetical protein